LTWKRTSTCSLFYLNSRHYCLFSTIHVDRHSGDVVFTGRGFIGNLVCIVYNAAGQIIARYELVGDKHEFPSLLSYPANEGRRLAADNGQLQQPQQNQLPPSAAAPAAAASASTHYLLALAKSKSNKDGKVSCMKLYRHVPNQVGYMTCASCKVWFKCGKVFSFYVVPA
jgi:hypothetical protein